MRTLYGWVFPETVLTVGDFRSRVYVSCVNCTTNQLYSHKGGGGVRGGCENVRPENNFSKNREREITFTEIREREIRKYIDNREYIYI